MTAEKTAPGTGIPAFVQHWFDILSSHEPVEELLAHVVDDGLEMVFPERTLRSHADFRDWYEVVGEAFADQSHVVERLDVDEDGTGVGISLTVVWTAKQTSDGTVSSFRIQQTWRLVREAGTGRPLISRYRVGDLAPA
ncbi:nuclear transport factor 2 family protein [Streptomyces sp. NPDC048111]|uniref:nuclear transport factor 2 family protein n=1 Tax=Streptomyces sp. NPDC048111 TaxID=3365500 RepID=UPI0037130B7F